MQVVILCLPCLVLLLVYQGNGQDFLTHLVDLEEPFSDHFHREILLQLVVVNGILLLLHTSHVVAEVPHVDLAVKLVAVLLTVFLLVLQEERHLAFLEGLKFLGQFRQECVHFLGRFSHSHVQNKGGVGRESQKISFLETLKAKTC